MWIFLRILTITYLIIVCIEEIRCSPTYQENNSEENKLSPGFLTIGQKYSYAVGSTVVLPCKINITDKNIFVLAWKRGNAVLTAANIKVTMNPRVRLIPPVHDLPKFEMNGDNDEASKLATGYNLELRDVRVADAGEYACQIGTIEPQEIVHKLEILVPPKIDYISPIGERLDIMKGSPIRLECTANGNPHPKIIWSRKNNLMPNGEANFTGNVFEILQSDRNSAGYYSCVADNRVGNIDSREIFVNVLFPPEVETERTFVHTGIGFESQLTCLVHSEPPANVIWFRDMTQLVTTEQHSLQNRGNRYSIIIRNVTYLDLGNYTCQATNNLGKDKGFLTLSGIPTICNFDSKSISDFKERYNISWSVVSHSPIREYRLFYRKQSTKSYMLTQQIQQHLEKTNENSLFGSQNQYQTPHSFGLSDQWENVVIPENFPEYYPRQPSTFNLNDYNYNGHINIHHHMSFLIKNIAPSTSYEARVQARNDHGWNKLSNVFHFSSRSEDFELESSQTPTVLRSAGLLNQGWLSSKASKISLSANILGILSNVLLIKIITNKLISVMV